MKPERYEIDIQVTPEHVDALGHVNNVTFLQLVQDLAEAHWNARATEELKAYGWVVLNHFIEYKGNAGVGDTITGLTYIGKSKGVRCERFAEFFHNGKLLVKSRSEWCMVDLKSLRPVRVPKDFETLFSEKD